jgi:diguanylate cyclase (GGDEF)-like protein
MSAHAPRLSGWCRAVVRVARALVWVSACVLGLVPAAASATETVRWAPAAPAIGLVASAEWLEDRSGRLDLAGARQASGWQRGRGTAFSFGYTASSFWLRWRIENTSDQPGHAVVDLGQPRHDLAHWFVLRQGGTQVDEARGGDRLPFAAQPLPLRNIALPLPLAPREQVELWVRLSTHDGLYEALPVSLHSRAGFEAAMDTENKLLMLFHGGVLALGLYNLLLFMATRQAAFGHYAHYIAWFLAWNLTSRGYAWQHLWPNAPAFNNDFLTVATAGVFATVGLFSIAYLRLRETVSRPWLVAVQVFIALNIADALVALTGHYALGVMLGWATGLPLGVLTLAIATRLLLRGDRPARFYVLAFTLLCVGAAAYIAQIATLAPVNWFSTWGVQIGSVFEVLLLALGLADSLNTLRAEKLAAERRARQAQQAVAGRLEAEVRERTHALDLANRRLHELSITDELTGAFNRRHFNDFCSQLLEHQPRHEPLAFCMFDLDHFKSFNDALGHKAGDQALRAVAGAVRAELRRSGDLLFRLGGEEFGLLFTAKTPESAQQFVERLRQSIRELRIDHPGSPVRIVTASFGLAWWGSPAATALTRDELYAQADELLYGAKAAGRDRVALLVV